MRDLRFAGLALVLLAAPSVGVAAESGGTVHNWPQWRGPLAKGISRTANPPVEWAENKNVRWKVEIPGRGSASPVVWGDRVFVLTAIPAGTTGADDPPGITALIFLPPRMPPASSIRVANGVPSGTS